MMTVKCSWCNRDMGVKDGPNGVTHGICIGCVQSEGHYLSPSQWILLVSIELDQLGNDTSKPMDWKYPMAENELRRLSGERNLPTFQEADPRIPVDARPLFGFARQYADGCN